MKLRPYQEEDVTKLISRQAMGVFNEQRTGKTPTSLVACQRYGATKILIVAPASLLYNWKDEYERWIGDTCTAIDGRTKDKRIKQISEWTHGLAINYEALRDTASSKGLWQLLLKHKPDAIILDEAHRIKGRTNATAKAVNKFKNVPYKLALTGTPAPNKQDEVWAILHWLYPKNFSSYWHFVEDYFIQEFNGFSEYGKPITLKPVMIAKFQHMLDAISINRKRKDIMPWLPDQPKPMKIRLPLSKPQKKQLMELEKYFETEGLITQGVLDRLIRERQICNAPHLAGLPGPSPKLNWIKQYLADYPDRPTILFSRFSTWLRYVQKETHGRVEVYDGQVPLHERERLKKDFQDGKINVLAIQIDAGKEGLTLDRAECLVFTDAYPPASDYLQARDRIVATTPDKAHIPKQIIELMMRDSYDEELYHLVEHNVNATDAINSYMKYKRQRSVMK